MDEGDHSTFEEYNRRYNALNNELTIYKSRKQEHHSREDIVDTAFKKLRDFEDKVGDLKSKKKWIKDEQRQEILDKINETKGWIEEQYNAQKEVPLHKDPVFKTSEVSVKLKRVEAIYTRVSNIAKPKPQKMDNIKIDNVTIDGNNAGDWGDFIKINNGKEDKEEGANSDL